MQRLLFNQISQESVRSGSNKSKRDRLYIKAAEESHSRPIRSRSREVTNNLHEDELENLPIIHPHQRNIQMNAAEQQFDEEELNTHQEQELSQAIRKFCEEACRLGSNENFEQSLAILDYAEKLLKEQKSNNSMTQFELNFLVYHNLAAICYR